MAKLTDLEIEKRIAKIEGIEVSESVMMLGGNPIPTGRGLITDKYIVFSPLTDDALCFQLMVKYKIQFMPSKFTPRCDGRKQFGAVSDDLILRSNNPNKAICLAIVEANPT